MLSFVKHSQAKAELCLSCTPWYARIRKVPVALYWQSDDAVNGVQVEPAAANKKARLLIPDDEVERVMNEVAVQEGPTGLLKLAGIKNIVEGWYVPHALAF